MKNKTGMTFRDKMACGYYGGNNQSQFRDDALAELGLLDNPKATLLYHKAWDLGHSAGYSEVWYYLEDLAELIK